MAIGDPLQFDKTVTVGVVSGKGRAPGLSNATRSFENLIQTDAAINFGNSGGPLVNVAGEVIGINTAISRFAQNIGFAVPINVARRLLPQLKEGKVVRGFLGISIGPVEADVQESLGLKSRDGALVQSVEKGMPADKAGIRHEDVIVRVDQTPVKNNRDLIDYVSAKRPGTKVTLTFIRGGKEKTTVATLETRREEGEVTEEEPAADEHREKIGISVDDLTPALRSGYSIGKDIEGVVLTHVKNVSAAADAGLREGDVIQEVNGKPVTTVEEFRAELKKAGDARFARFYVLPRRAAPRELHRRRPTEGLTPPDGCPGKRPVPRGTGRFEFGEPASGVRDGRSRGPARASGAVSVMIPRRDRRDEGPLRRADRKTRRSAGRSRAASAASSSASSSSRSSGSVPTGSRALFAVLWIVGWGGLSACHGARDRLTPPRTRRGWLASRSVEVVEGTVENLSPATSDQEGDRDVPDRRAVLPDRGRADEGARPEPQLRSRRSDPERRDASA